MYSGKHLDVKQFTYIFQIDKFKNPANMLKKFLNNQKILAFWKI